MSDFAEFAGLTTLIEHPEFFVRAYFKDGEGQPLQLVSYQRELCSAILSQKFPRIACFQATQSGKTTTLASSIALEALLFPYEKIAIIAPTKGQASIIYEQVKQHLVEDNPEIRKYVDLNKSREGRKEFSKNRMFMKNDTEVRIFATGEGDTEDVGESLLGYAFTKGFLDESSSIPDKVYYQKLLRMAGSKRANKIQKMIVESGTTHRANHFYQTSLDSNYFKLYVPWQLAVSEGRLDEAFVLRQRELMSNNDFRRWYCAEFVVDEEDNAIKREWLENSIKRPESTITFDHYVLGIDPARFGRDLTVFSYVGFSGELAVLLDLKKWSNLSTSQVVGKFHQFVNGDNTLGLLSHQVDKVIIDDTGIGGGITDPLKADPLWENKTIGFIFGSNPFTIENVKRRLNQAEELANVRFLNKKSYYYNQLARKFEYGKIILSPSIELQKLKEELLRIKFEVTNDKKTKVVNEKDTEKSPDYADSLMLAASDINESRFAFAFA